MPVPRLGFGGASLGNLYRQVSDADAHATLSAAWDAGIRMYDTAPHYGLGLSERRMGAFLSSQPRDDYLISTKVGRVLVADPDFGGRRDVDNGFDVPADHVRVFDPSADGIRRSLDGSLSRLGIDRVDILYLHDPDAYDLDLGLADGLPALAALRDEGLVDLIGIGTNSAAAATRAVREHDIDLVMIAGRYTLLDRDAATELLPLCVERGVGVVAVGVYNSGLLATEVPGGTFNYQPASNDVVARARRLAQLCADFDVALPTAALQFPLRHPAVVAELIAMSSADHLRETMARFAVEVPEQLWARLDEGAMV
jgi:D-threo-aldose 1-dehydrogenase